MVHRQITYLHSLCLDLAMPWVQVGEGGYRTLSGKASLMATTTKEPRSGNLQVVFGWGMYTVCTTPCFWSSSGDSAKESGDRI